MASWPWAARWRIDGGIDVTSGTLKIDGNNSFSSGAINVGSGATLALSNSAWVASTASIASGGTLSGNGHIDNATIHAGGILSPGTAACPIGEITFEDLTLMGQSTIVVGVKSDGSGNLENSTIRVESSYTLTLSGIDATHPLSLKLISDGLLGGLVENQPYTVSFLHFQNQTGTALDNTNVDFSLSTLDTGFANVTYSIALVGNDYVVTFTPVPEPATYALMALGLAGTGLAPGASAAGPDNSLGFYPKGGLSRGRLFLWHRLIPGLCLHLGHMKQRIAGLLCSILLMAVPLRAVVVTWTGAGGGGNVTNGANWSSDPATPSDGDNLLFPLVTNRLVTINVPTFTAGDISFTNATNFSFNGSGSPTLVVAGNVTLQNTNVNFLNSLQVQLAAGSHTFTNDAPSVFEFTSAISGSGSLVKSGAGLLSIYSAATYTGGTSITEGSLNVDASVSGPASLSHASADMIVSGTSGASLLLAGGATVTNAQGIIGANNGESGDATVKGAGSTWTSLSNLYVGNGGNGVLYLYDGGQLNVSGGAGTINLGHSATGAGVLKIGTDGDSTYAGGVINAAEITTGAGLSGELKFATTGTALNPYYLTKDGLSSGAAVLISGPTEVENVAGFTVLKSANTYSGATHISGGTLIVSNQDALGSSTVTVNGGTLVVNNINLFNTLNLSSGKLAGSGYVPMATIGTGFTLSPGLPATEAASAPGIRTSRAGERRHLGMEFAEPERYCRHGLG